MDHLVVDSDICRSLKSDEPIIGHNLSASLCSKMLCKIFDVVTFGIDGFTKDHDIHNTKGEISLDTIIVISNQLKGKNNITPTWLKKIVAEKGEGVY